MGRADQTIGSHFHLDLGIVPHVSISHQPVSRQRSDKARRHVNVIVVKGREEEKRNHTMEIWDPGQTLLVRTVPYWSY
jgi:hypothetical protein